MPIPSCAAQRNGYGGVKLVAGGYDYESQKANLRIKALSESRLGGVESDLDWTRDCPTTTPYPCLDAITDLPACLCVWLQDRMW